MSSYNLSALHTGMFGSMFTERMEQREESTGKCLFRIPTHFKFDPETSGECAQYETVETSYRVLYLNLLGGLVNVPVNEAEVYPPSVPAESNVGGASNTNPQKDDTFFSYHGYGRW